MGGLDHFPLTTRARAGRASVLTISSQEVLSDLADILAAEEEAESACTAAAAEGSGGGRGGSEVSMGALTAAVHLLQWDQQVVRVRRSKGRMVGNSARLRSC